MMTLSVVSRSRRGRAFVAMMVMAACSDGPTSPVTDGTGARGLAVGEETTCALDTDGALYCWGLNSTRFEYGTAPAERASSPTPVKMTLPPTAGTSPATLEKPYPSAFEDLLLKKSPQKRAFSTFSLYNVCGFPYDEVAIQKAEAALEIGAHL